MQNSQAEQGILRGGLAKTTVCEKMEYRKVGLVMCPYDSTHWVKPTRMGNHIAFVHKVKKEEPPKIECENWDDEPEVGTYHPKIVYHKNGRRKY